ncbi:GTP-binding protein [Mangrovibacterium sp.]|uniref:CobW family GTP-binding protein n=1 Tax=Mangrovibacterium sp. TaxID=1961364 RepID=UPI00356A0ABF
MIPFYIVTGWLGSGKTTLLKNILTHYGNSYRIAVIQNEFAPTGVDGKELQNTGTAFKLVEINNGSVFCVCQLGNFVEALEQLADSYTPDAIFLESSGLADPISVVQILNAPAIKDKINLKKIITVIDAVHFERTFQMMPRFKHQVMVADQLIINKSEEPGTSSQSVVGLLKKWNPFADYKFSNYCNINLKDLFDDDAAMGKSRRFLPIINAGNKPEMNVSVLRVHDLISETQLTEFIQELLPSSYRIKGFVNTSEGNTIAIQAVLETIEFARVEKYEGRSELIIFNNQYSNHELEQRFKAKVLHV